MWTIHYLTFDRKHLLCVCHLRSISLASLTKVEWWLWPTWSTSACSQYVLGNRLHTTSVTHHSIQGANSSYRRQFLCPKHRKQCHDDTCVSSLYYRFSNNCSFQPAFLSWPFLGWCSTCNRMVISLREEWPEAQVFLCIYLQYKQDKQHNPLVFFCTCIVRGSSDSVRALY